MLGAALAISGGCMLLDALRLGLFRLLRVRQGTRWLENRLQKLLSKF